MSQPLGVILAGGRASRMGGGDKGRHMLAGQSLIDHVIERLSPQVAGLALNANGDPARFSDLGLPVLPDPIPDLPGPLAGVLAGLDWAASQGAERIVTAAADTPFLPLDLVHTLQTACEGRAHPLGLAATREQGKLWRHPTFGIWPVALRDDLRRALEGGLRKVVLWTDKHKAIDVEFPVTTYDPFFNVNTPEDLIRAQTIAKGLQ